MTARVRGDGKMPSENDMVKAFDVSRITVRQALNDLQKEGLIFKIDFEYLYYRGDAFQYFMMVGRRDATHARAAGVLPGGARK